MQRLKLVISCLLAVLLAGGSVLPPPALWQCHHSSRLVSAAFAAAPSAMPCLMGRSALNDAMPSMPCCHPGKSAASRSPQNRQAFSAFPCHPVLTSLAAVPAPGVREASSSLRQSLSAMQAVLPMTATFAVSALITLTGRQRPPPTFSFSPSPPAYSFGLRAPPAA